MPCIRPAVAVSAILLLLPVSAMAGSATTTGSSNLMNPALSLNGLMAARTADDNPDPLLNGIRIQEAELHASAIVDPFWTADVIISAAPNDPADGFDVLLEEVRVDGTALPYGLGVRLGKFFPPFGKHAPLHTHQFPFVDSPLAVQSFIGDGYTDTGAQFAWPVPLAWYSDLFVYGVDGTTEMFDNAARDLVWGARWTNLWDLGDETTCELGGSYADGPADPLVTGTTGRYGVAGVDLTLKWVSMASSHGPALTVQGELLLPDREGAAGSPLGWYALAQYRLHHNWWLGATHGRVDFDNDADPASDEPFTGLVRETKFNLTYIPSEFSALRAEIGYRDDRLHDRDELRAALQLNFTIGSHPAHSY
ncbi:MAG: hypothetical protein GY838_12150 [bacterium]|nr:hypothetical protein [bacterium]